MIVGVMAGVLTDMVVGALAISSRSGIGRLDAYSRVGSVVTGEGAEVHSVSDIDPDVPANMSAFVAFELIQASPQRFWLKDAAR